MLNKLLPIGRRAIVVLAWMLTVIFILLLIKGATDRPDAVLTDVVFKPAWRMLLFVGIVWLIALLVNIVAAVHFICGLVIWLHNYIMKG